jgi:hypothetical protein
MLKYNIRVVLEGIYQFRCYVGVDHIPVPVAENSAGNIISVKVYWFLLAFCQHDPWLKTTKQSPVIRTWKVMGRRVIPEIFGKTRILGKISGIVFTACNNKIT